MNKYTPKEIEKEIINIYYNYPTVVFRAIKEKGCAFDPITKIASFPKAPSGNRIHERFLVANNLPIVNSELDYMKHAVKTIINQFEILNDVENISSNMSDRLIISNEIYSISADLRIALNTVNKSKGTDIAKIDYLKQVLFDKYNKLQTVKKMDILNLYEHSTLTQIESILEADIYYFSLKYSIGFEYNSKYS